VRGREEEVRKNVRGCRAMGGGELRKLTNGPVEELEMRGCVGKGSKEERERWMGCEGVESIGSEICERD